jgi:hypothetical protein
MIGLGEIDSLKSLGRVDQLVVFIGVKPAALDFIQKPGKHLSNRPQNMRPGQRLCLY